MSKEQRRQFMGLIAAFAAERILRAAPASGGRLSAPPPPNALPKAWVDAPRMALWPGEPPGAAGFRSQPLPSDWSPAFIRNVAQPELRIFRPARPNGRAVLVIPGG